MLLSNNYCNNLHTMEYANHHFCIILCLFKLLEVGYVIARLAAMARSLVSL